VRWLAPEVRACGHQLVFVPRYPQTCNEPSGDAEALAFSLRVRVAPPEETLPLASAGASQARTCRDYSWMRPSVLPAYERTVMS
jgi:hypothetical protein